MGRDEILNKITRDAACGAGKKRRKQSGTALREGRGGRKQETPPRRKNPAGGGSAQMGGNGPEEGCLRLRFRRFAFGGRGKPPLYYLRVVFAPCNRRRRAARRLDMGTARWIAPTGGFVQRRGRGDGIFSGLCGGCGRGGFCLVCILPTPNAPGQRAFSRCAASFFLEIRQYSCKKMSCSARKFLAAGYIASWKNTP